MVIEIGELDNASQSAVLAGCVGDALHVGAVVVVLSAREERKRAEFDRAQSPRAQLVHGQIRTLQDVVQPSGDARVLGHRGCHALDVIEPRAAGRGLLAAVNGLGDGPRGALSHRLLHPSLTVTARWAWSALPVSLATGARWPQRCRVPALR